MMMEHHYYYYYCTPQKSLVGSCRATCTSLAWSCTNYLYHEGQEMDTELKYTKLKEGSSMKTDGTRQASLSVIGDAPKRPEDPHQGVGEHKKECDDWCRPTLFGHEYHWSELLILLLLSLSLYRNCGFAILFLQSLARLGQFFYDYRTYLCLFTNKSSLY